MNYQTVMPDLNNPAFLALSDVRTIFSHEGHKMKILLKATRCPAGLNICYL